MYYTIYDLKYFKERRIKTRKHFMFIKTFNFFRRARGYPEPLVTWRREDGNEIILKDSMGTKTHGKLLSQLLTFLILNRFENDFFRKKFERHTVFLSKKIA